MRHLAGIILLTMLAACGGGTILVTVPPRMPLQNYGTLGIVGFSANADRGAAAHATRKFQEEVQAAQPGTPFLELGDLDSVLASVGAAQLDPAALKKIGAKYGVRAVFVGELVYSEPKMDVKVMDLAKLEGGVQAEMRGDISSRLLETASGASIWSSSAWARRQLGAVHISAEQGVSGAMSQGNPRDEMVPALVYHLTEDFRPTTERQAVR